LPSDWRPMATSWWSTAGPRPTPGALADELGDAIYVQAGLAQDEDRCRLALETVAAVGRPDVLVNNAGISGAIRHADLQAATPETWRKLYEVNA
jgi:NAD(P)-dependent dehydrogenase (short-subunit alcohol dehydrogenase family)